MVGSLDLQVYTTAKKKGRHQGRFCSWKLQKGKNSQYEFLVSILTGWSVLWFLISCVVQIKWHWLPAKRSSNNPLHLPQVYLHWNPAEQKQPVTVRKTISTKAVSSTSFQQDNLECMGQASGMQLWIDNHNKWREQSAWVLTERAY